MKKKLTILLLILLVAINCLIVVPVSAFAQSNDVCDDHSMHQADVASTTSGYQLQYNTWDGEWNNYEDYNCYAFALGRTDSFYNPGMFSGHNSDYLIDHYELYNNVRKRVLKDVTIIKDCVYDDLQYLGYNCIVVTQNSYRSPVTGVNLICLRNGYDIPSGINNVDYHFMKYDNGSWYHKPGATAILKYNSVPTPSEPWIGEGVTRILWIKRAERFSTDYVGDIYFFAFQQNCRMISVYYNGSVHRTACGNCDKNAVYEPHTMVSHQMGQICSACGYLIKKNGEVITPWNNEDLI